MIAESLLALSAGTLALSGGGSGLLSVPDAGTMQEDTFEYQHSNGLLSTEPTFGLGQRARITDYGVTDHIQMSLYPGFEFGARLTTWYKENTRERHVNDLSGHFKLQLWNQNNFRFAVGARDFAGEAENFAPVYFVVGDWARKNWQVTLGLGESESEGSALDGVFGGVRYTPFSWLSMLYDYDGVATNAGLQLNARVKDALWYIKGSYSSNDYQNYSYSLGFRLSLGKARGGGLAKTWIEELSAPRAHYLNIRDSMILPWAADQFSYTYQTEFESNPDCENRMSLHAYGVPMLSIDCLSSPHVDWLSSWTGSALAYWGHLEIRSHPVFVYLLGSSFGRLDYSLALRTSTQLNIAAGLSAYGVWDSSIYNTDLYRDSENSAFAPLESKNIESAMQYTAHVWSGTFLQLTAGKSRILDKMRNFQRYEFATFLWKGRMALNFSHTKFNSDLNRLASYQNIGKLFMWLKPAKYAVEYTRGNFLFNDTGQKFELFKYIGRTRLGLYYKDGFNPSQAAIGMTFNVALTGKRSLGNRWVSFKSHPQFLVPLETQINTGTNANELKVFFMGEFVPQRQLIRDILDRWRMSPIYIEGR